VCTAAILKPDVADVVRDCLAWLERQGLAAAPLDVPDAGAGVSALVVQAFTLTFFVDVRATFARPTRAHLNRQACWISHGARSLSVRSAAELEMLLCSSLRV
jgi:hypothetical protein